MRRFAAVVAVLGLVLAVGLGAAPKKEKKDAPAKPKGAITVPEMKIDNTGMDKLGWKLSCQAYTFGRTKQWTLYETIDLLKQLGVRYIELYPGQALSPDKPDVKADHNMSDELLDGLKAKLKEAGITPVNYGVVGCGKTEAEARKVFDFAKKLGLETIVTEPEESTLPMLDKLAQEYKINIALHNHPKPSKYWDPAHVLEVCQGRSNRIGSCSDVGHWYRSGLVSLDCLKKMEGRIISLHFKDLASTGKGHSGKSDVIWGTGEVNAKALLQEIQRQGIKPVFSIEYEITDGQELVDNVAKSIQWFANTANELAK